MSNLMAIDWKDRNVGIDYIPWDWFSIKGDFASRKHTIFVPATGATIPALCDIRVDATEATLDYTSSACRKFNMLKGVVLGKLKIRFTNSKRTKVSTVYWMRQRGGFENADVYVTTVSEIDPDDIDLSDVKGKEGKGRLVQHLLRERDPRLVRAKKKTVLNAKGRLECEACDFDFSIVYPGLGEKFCEVHQRISLGNSSKRESTTTSLEDLAILCSNCHRMIHRTKPMESVPTFRRRLKRQAWRGGAQQGASVDRLDSAALRQARR